MCGSGNFGEMCREKLLLYVVVEIEYTGSDMIVVEGYIMNILSQLQYYYNVSGDGFKCVRVELFPY